MNQYLLVIYDKEVHDFYNRVVVSSSKDMAAVEFMYLKREKDVLVNIMNYGQSTENT